VANIHALMLDALDDSGHKALLIADENCLDLPFPALGHQVCVLSNRVDVAAKASEAGLTTFFSDFDFSPFCDNQALQPQRVVYRLSKEKPVVHHIANRVSELLPEGGDFIFWGAKQEGVKTFAKTLGQRFGCSPHMEKHGANYQVRLQKNGGALGAPLDDKNYSQLREIGAIGDKPVYSKPGVFGWDKMDSGSALLGQFLPEFFSRHCPLRADCAPALLDLGCGYGYLSLVAAPLNHFTITATDNCAAALLACTKNFAAHTIDGTVIAADCADTISAKFDVILCNPPFHQGFQQDRALSEKFLSATKRLLAADGRALFVVNQFVPLETLAAGKFRKIATPVNNGSFKLVVLGH